MARALDPLEQLADIVQTESRPERAQVASLHGEPLARGRGRWAGKPPAQSVIDDLAKGSARSPGQGLQLGRDVIIECQCCAHILMLSVRHHDVNRGMCAAGPAEL